MPTSARARFHDLLFLMTLPPLVVGCPGGDDSGTDTNSTNNATTTTGQDDSTGEPPATDDNGTTAGGSGGSGSSGPGPGTTTDAETEGTTGLLECEERPPPVGEIDPLCVAQTALLNDCYYDGDFPQSCIDLYEAYCQYQLEEIEMGYSMECFTAYEDYLACITTLSCVEFLDDVDDCPDELTNFETTCGIE